MGTEQKGCLEESICGRISTGEDDIHRKISLGREHPWVQSRRDAWRRISMGRHPQ